jgi:hypothetical protein
VAPYVTLRIGVESTRGLPYVLHADALGLGVVAKGGPFIGSYLEIAGGRNQQFAHDACGATKNVGEGCRLRGDALLSFRINQVPWIRDKTRLFIEGVLDEGPRPQATSYRTFFGMDIDLRELSK